MIVCTSSVYCYHCLAFISTLIPRLSVPGTYGHFGLPGTLWASFSGNTSTLLSLFCGNSDVIMPFPHENVCDSELGTFQSYGQCPVPDRPDKRGMNVLEYARLMVEVECFFFVFFY